LAKHGMSERRVMENKIKNLQGKLRDTEQRLELSHEEHNNDKRVLSKQTQLTQKKLRAKEEECLNLHAQIERYKLNQKFGDLSNRDLVIKYQTELKRRDEKITVLKSELRNIMSMRNNEIETLTNRLTNALNGAEKDPKTDSSKWGFILGNLGNLRAAVTAERTERTTEVASKHSKLPVHEKTQAERDLIRMALLDNFFFRRLNKEQIEKLIDAMARRNYPKGAEIISEGADGVNMYILVNGEVRIMRGKEQVCNLHPGCLFGEMAILYNCKRTASVIASDNITAWSIDRSVFKMVVKVTGEQKNREKYDLLASIKALSGLSERRLWRIADCLEEEVFEPSSRIIKQGTIGDAFYVIRAGNVKVTVDSVNEGEKQVATKTRGEFFGEVALMKEDLRTANVYAVDTVACYVLERKAFTRLIGSLSDAKKEIDLTEVVSQPKRIINPLVKKAKLEDLKIIRALGAGAFGLVKLVKVKGIDHRAFALKCIQKHQVVQYKQERHIKDEKNTLQIMQSPFILGLLKTFKDKKFVYLLTDAYLGGDLWGMLVRKGPFKDSIARFYIACVVEAFEYLHVRLYCYRDLKPENLMIDNNGYVRLVDLGFAKYVEPGQKTWTFCGTPEYIAPEILTNTGHNHAADYWSLGILIYELLTKNTPFRAKDDVSIYKGILQGIHSVQFPFSKIAKRAENVIKALCATEPSDRLGYQREGLNGIRKHRWFEGFDWEALQNETITAPIIPPIKNPFDASNFSKVQEEDSRKIPEENSGWDVDF